MEKSKLSTNVPQSYIDYYNSNQTNFTSQETLDLDADTLEQIKELSSTQDIPFNLFINYFLLQIVIHEKMKDEEDFGFGMLLHDFQLYSEDEIADLISKNKRIAIFDEKSNKTAVILDVGEYEALYNHLPK